MKHTHKKNTIILFSLLMAAILILTACNAVGPNRGNNANLNKKYYQGYDSLELSFLQDSPPSIFYYDGDPQSILQNEIPIIVEVKNKGVSDAYGALHIHGYDRSIVSVAGDKGVTSCPQCSPTTLNFGGIYIGLRGSGQTALQIGFHSPSVGNNPGVSYGLSVFGQGGQIRSFSVGITQGRIGSRLAPFAFNMLTSYFGYNAPIALEGDTPLNPGGGVEIYEFPALIYNLPPSVEQFRQPIMVTACYDYVTHSTAMICIDPNPQSNTKKACFARTVSMSGGQGAPVAITKVEQQSSREKVVLTIYVKHNKKNSLDDLFDYNSLWKCDPESAAVVKPTDKNVVYIGYIALSGMDITMNCKPDSKIRLDQSGSGQVSCTAYFPQNSESAYEAPLEIELWYGYSKNIYKEITIKRI